MKGWLISVFCLIYTLGFPLYGQKIKEDTLNINELVVVGSKSVRPIKLSPITTKVLVGKAILEQGYNDFSQALQRESPGLTIQKVSFGNEINLNGLDARHILFLIDGQRLTGDMAGNLDYERFNIHSIERVEIIKGASSTIYGSRASGAVINIITKKTYKPYSIDVGVRYGQMNEVNFNNISPRDFLYMYEKNADKPNIKTWVSAGFNKGIFTSQTDLCYSLSDAFNIYPQKEDIKVYTKKANPFLKKDLIIKQDFPRPPMGIDGKEHITFNQKFYIEPSSRFKFIVYGNGFYMNIYDLWQDLNFTQSKDFTYGATLSYSLKNYFSVNATIHKDKYYRYKRHERINSKKIVYDSEIFMPSISISSNYFNNHSLIAGAEFYTDNLTSDKFAESGELRTMHLDELEYYIQDDFLFNKTILISGGLRSSYSVPFGIKVMPKLAIKYSPTSNISLRANYSISYRSPSIKELYFNWPNLGMFMIRGNARLNPEKNTYISLGVEYDKPKFFINANVYGNFFNNKIDGVWRIYDLQYNFEYQNLKTQNIIGVDAVCRYTPINKTNQSLVCNASYAYVNISKTNGLQFNTTSPHSGFIGANYKYNKGNYSIGGNVSLQIVGQKKYNVQDRVFDKEEKTNRNAYFTVNLPPYCMCNINVFCNYKERYRVTIGVDNAFNYIPKTIGTGLTAFSVPATAGVRSFVQFEIKL